MSLAFLVVLALVAWAATALLMNDDEASAPAAVPAQAGGEAIPGAGEEFDGCRFVQRWDAHEILQGSVRPVPKPTEHVAAATCAWEVVGDETARSLQLSVFRNSELYDPEPFEDDATFEHVDGIGDEAFLVASSGVQLHVLVGDSTVLVSVTGFGEGSPLDREMVKGHVVELAGRVSTAL